MKPVLLLIDLQLDFLAATGLQPPANLLVARAALLLGAWRQRGLPVIHLWTTVRPEDDQRLLHWRKAGRWLCVAGTPGHAAPPPLEPLAGELVVHKTGFNPFRPPELAVALCRLGCAEVVLAGLHLHACVRTAAAECLERGYEVLIPEDAVATHDPVHAAAACRWLAERGVQFEPMHRLLARLDGVAPSVWIHRSPRRTEQILFEVPVASPAEISAAAAAAQHAWTHWQRVPVATRRALLTRLAEHLDAAVPELAHQMGREIGKPLNQAREEVSRAAFNLRDVARRAQAPACRQETSAGEVRRRPLGVIAVISTWNNPVAIPLGKIAPALVYGNTVVWKPAPAATGLAQRLLRLLHNAGFPADAVRLVTGDATAARQLASAAPVDAVTLTGAAWAGHVLQGLCAQRAIPFQAELNGNNAAILWDDTNVELAAREIASGAFGFAGQRCTANRRVIVPAAQAESMWHALQQAASQLAWGDPLDEGTVVGPMIELAKRDEHTAIIERAQQEQAIDRVVYPHGARANEPWAHLGAYAAPVIVNCPEPGHSIVQEETMSPLLVVQHAEDFEQALALCNGVRQGLCAALFSNSPKRQRQFLNRAQAGVLKLNRSTAGVDVTLPFGGWKTSGVGPPEHGEADRLFYTRWQTVYRAPPLP
jgi:acyl-CoA reductase-like NAD-dependent aldehyde dehydrogenase/nicotinamidase-related amidase